MQNTGRYLRPDLTLLGLGELRKSSTFGSAFHFFQYREKEDRRRGVKAKNSTAVS